MRAALLRRLAGGTFCKRQPGDSCRAAFVREVLFGDAEWLGGDVEGEGGAEDCEGGEFHVGFAVFYFAEGCGGYAGGFGEAAQRHATREACQADFVANVDAEVTDDGFFGFGCQHGLFTSDFGYRCDADVVFA